MTTKMDPALVPDDLSQAEQTSIIDYARDLETLYRRWEDLQGQEGAQLSAAISAIENRILAIPAETTLDAAVQIMLISSLVEQLRVDRGSAKEELLDRLEGSAMSAVGALIRQLKLDLSGLGGTHYLPGLVGPLSQCDDRVQH